MKPWRGQTAFERYRVGQVAGEMCKLTPRAASANTTAKACEWILMDATAGARTVAGPPHKEGITWAVRKTDVSANPVSMLQGAGGPLLLLLPSPGDTAVYRSTSGAWELVAADLLHPPGAGYFPAERGGKYATNNLPAAIQNAISLGPVSFGFLLVPYATGASLGGAPNADFFGNRAGSYIGSYMTVDASGGFTGASTRSSGEDACSPRWTPGPTDMGKVHSLVYTLSSNQAGAAQKFYVNGALIGSSTLGSGLASNNALRVGFSGVAASPQSYPNIGCAGSMVVGKVMSLAEIQAWNTRLIDVGAFVLPDIADTTAVMGWEAPTANTKTMSGRSNIDAAAGNSQISFVAAPSAFSALTRSGLAFYP